MRIYTCHHCLKDNHAKCERTHRASPGHYGGSKCDCPCDGDPKFEERLERERVNEVQGLNQLLNRHIAPEQPQGQVGADLHKVREALEEIRGDLEASEMPFYQACERLKSLLTNQFNLTGDPVTREALSLLSHPQPNAVKLAIEALEFYANVNHWEMGIANGSIAGAEDGEPFMAFSQGEDHPWVPAKEALTALSVSSETRDGLREYIAARRRTIEASIAAEVLAGNSFKETCERTALAEITALEIHLAAMRNDGGAKV